MKFVERAMGEAAEASSGGGDRGLIKEIITLGVLSLLTLIAVGFIAAWIVGILAVGSTPKSRDLEPARQGDLEQMPVVRPQQVGD